MLAANLMSEKPAAPSEAPETPAETAAAERLVELALAEAKALDRGEGEGATPERGG